MARRHNLVIVDWLKARHASSTCLTAVMRKGLEYVERRESMGPFGRGVGDKAERGGDIQAIGNSHVDVLGCAQRGRGTVCSGVLRHTTLFIRVSVQKVGIVNEP